MRTAQARAPPGMPAKCPIRGRQRVGHVPRVMGGGHEPEPAGRCVNPFAHEQLGEQRDGLAVGRAGVHVSGRQDLNLRPPGPQPERSRRTQGCSAF